MDDKLDTIDRIRAFNRFYTSQIGLVGRSNASGGLSLSELRVLYEIHLPDPPTARQLARDLGLDEGYLSRIIARFVKRGWVARRRDPGDQRVSRLTLTGTGRAVADRLVSEARERIKDVVADLDSAQQAQIVGAMATVQKLLSGAGDPVTVRDLAIGDSGWLIQQHAELYQREYGFDQGFEALVAEILSRFIQNRDPQRERAFIAHRGAQRLGSIFCMADGPDVAKLRLFLMVPEARGLGLGNRLMGDCLDYARSRNYRRMVLWTQKDLAAACALYKKFGFEVTSEETTTVFGVQVVSQNWEIEL